MKKLLALVLALVMTLGLATVGANAAYKDADSINYTEAVDVMSAIGVLAGDETGFRPADTLKRSEGAKIVAYLMLGNKTAEAIQASGTKFTDVPANHWAAGYIEYLASVGVLGGVGGGKFDPDGQLTATQFAKMLLCALGYDAAIEGLGGTDWSINVQKLANKVGLYSGNSSVVGTAAVTREEAALYSLNTIKAPLVEYSTKGTVVTIGDASVTTSASSAQYITNTADLARYTAIKNNTVNGTSGAAQIVEFAEEYYAGLVLTAPTDGMMRSTNTWTYKGAKVGEYPKAATLTYTTRVTSDKIYDDLGLTSEVTPTIYEDGVPADGTNGTEDNSAFTIKNGSTVKIGRTGMTTLVYKSVNDSTGAVTVKICKINTYVGDVTGVTAKTSTKDAYITVAARLDGAAAGTYETDDAFAVEDVVLYTYSKSGNKIGSVDKAPAAIEGELSAYTTGETATIGGTVYKYAFKIANEAGNTNLRTTVKAYLDQYGNVIDVEDGNTNAYAVVLRNSLNADFAQQAELLFTDGTTKTVKLSKNYADSDEYGDIVTYTIGANETYTLTQAQDNYDVSNGEYTVIQNGNYKFWVDTNDKTNPAGGGGTEYTANGDTIFLVKTQNANGAAVYNAYKGIANVPTIVAVSNQATAQDQATVYKKSGYGTLAYIVYVDATYTGSTVQDPSSDVIFVKGSSAGLSETSGIGNYYAYTAVVNGELKDENIRVSANNRVTDGNFGLYDAVSYDSNGIAYLGKASAYYGVGVYKQSNSVFGAVTVQNQGDVAYDDALAGSYAYYPAAKDLKVAKVATDGTITAGLGLASVTNDSNDKIWFRVNASGEIDYAFIVEVDGGTTTAATLYPVSIKATPNASFTYKIYDSTDTEVLASGVNGIDNTLAGGTAESIGLPVGTYTIEYKDGTDDNNVYETRTVAFEVKSTASGGKYSYVNGTGADVDYGAAAYYLAFSNITNLTGQDTYSVTVTPQTATASGVTYGGTTAFDKTANALTTTKHYYLANRAYDIAVSGSDGSFEAVTVAKTISTNTTVDLADGGDVWQIVTFKDMYPGSSVTLTHSSDTATYPSVTKANGAAKADVVLRVAKAATATDFNYAVTAGTTAATDKALLIAGTGAVTGANVTAAKFFLLNPAITTVAATSSGHTLDITIAADTTKASATLAEAAAAGVTYKVVVKTTGGADIIAEEALTVTAADGTSTTTSAVGATWQGNATDMAVTVTAYSGATELSSAAKTQTGVKTNA